MKFLLLFLLLSVVSCAPIASNLLTEQSRCVAVGSDVEPLALCFLTVDNRYVSSERNLLFLVDEGSIEQIANPGNGFETIAIKVSASRRYAALIEDAGEGHGQFTVIDLATVRNRQEIGHCGTVAAYPYGFSDLEWQGDSLSFTTYRNITSLEYDEDESTPLPIFHYRLLAAEDCRLELID